MNQQPTTLPSKYAITVTKDGKTTLAFDPTPAQLAIMQECLYGNHPNIFVFGNRGGGKSYMARWLAHTLALAFPNFRYKIIRKRFGELQETHLDFLSMEMDLLGGDYNKTEHTTRYANGSIGYFRQCASDEDAEKALGAEAYLCIFDESPTLEWNHMVKITGSVRVPQAAREQGVKPLVLYLGNPIGPSINELYSYFIDKDVDPDDNDNYFPADYHAIQLNLEQNPHQDIKAYRRRLASQTDPQYRKAWLDGERSLDQALFDFKPTITIASPITHEDVKQPYHVIDALPTTGDGRSILTEGWVRIYRSYDHGYTDPAVCLWFAVIGKRIICFKEQKWLRTNPLQIARDILQAQIIYINNQAHILHVTATYVDPSLDLKMSTTGVTNVGTKAAMESVTIQHGSHTLRLPLDTSINSREQFASSIHMALNEEVDPNTPRLQILAPNHDPAAPGCPYLIKSLPQQRYDERNPLKLADHKHDHPVVALAYMLMSYVAPTGPPKPDPRPLWWKEYGPKHQGRFVLGRESRRRR